MNDKGTFDCKGLEIIRRDSCDFVKKVFRELLELLYRENNLKFLTWFFNKIQRNLEFRNFSIRDFVFDERFKDRKQKVETRVAHVAKNITLED